MVVRQQGRLPFDRAHLPATDTPPPSATEGWQVARWLPPLAVPTVFMPASAELSSRVDPVETALPAHNLRLLLAASLAGV